MCTQHAVSREMKPANMYVFQTLSRHDTARQRDAQPHLDRMLKNYTVPTKARN